MSVLFAVGSPSTELSEAEARAGLFEALDKLGDRQSVLAIPPDFTRFQSKAGRFIEWAWERYGVALRGVLPALGTHRPVSASERRIMFGATPGDIFRTHDWRNDVVTLGEVPEDFVYEVSEGRVDYAWPAQVNKLLRDGGHDLILSIGQVVPHEVVGMAGGNKNIFVGTGVDSVSIARTSSGRSMAWSA